LYALGHQDNRASLAET